MVVERSLMLKTWSRVAQRARRNPYAGAGRIAQRGERRGELSSSCFVFVINTELLDMAQPGSSGQPSDLGSYAAYNSQLATNHVQQSAQQLENTNSSVHPYVFASAAHRQSSNPPAPAQSPPSSTQANMMGSSLPWNPNNNPLPDYPSPDALAAGYQAFLDTYTTPTTNTTNKGGQDNPAKSSFQSHSIGFHEGNDFEPRNSTSKPIGYSQHQYAPSDGYPPSNAMAHPHPHISTSGSNVQQKDGHGHARHQHQQPPQRQSTSSGDMFALSPESLSSSHDSPQLFGHGLTTSPPMHHQPHQYFSPDSQQYYAQQAYSDPHWQPAQHPQTASSHDTFHFQPHFLQQQHQQQQQQQHQQQSTYAPHAPPPGVNSNYGQGGGASSYSPYPGASIGGVAPHQINPGGSSANSANVGSNQPPINRQGRPMIPPRKAASQQPINLKAPTNPPQQATYVQKMNSQPNLAKGLALVAPVTKRKKLNEPEESSSEEEDEEYMELGTQPQQQGNNGGNKPSARLPGACAPCKRLKMRCVFPDGEKVCQRCRNSGRGNLCVVGPRKPRQPSNKKELLLQKLQERDSLIKSKDVVIQSLLEQLQNPHVQISLKDGPQAAAAASLGSSPGDQQNRPAERPSLDPAILAWIENAKASIKSTAGYRLTDARSINDSDSSSEESYGNTLDSHRSPTKSVSESGRSAGRSYGGSLAAPHDAHQPHKSSPKLHSRPLDVATPLGMMADLALKEKKKTSSRSGSKSRSVSGTDENDRMSGGSSGAGEDENAVGVANSDYFEAAPVSKFGLRSHDGDRAEYPEIMTSGLITPAEVEKLFKIFFDRLNVFVSILDPVLHTPATTFGRCPFLFTVVCAISSRYYVERPELYTIAMRFARRAAAESLIDAVKSVDLCQAYILMSVYSMPSRRWEDAREWLYLGLAIRMAIDLNLHVRTSTKIQSEQHERELLNRTRTWLICYNLDRSVSAQLGKPASIRPDPIIRSCKAIGDRPAWWNSSKANDPFDLHLCAYSELLSTIIAEFQERVYWDPKRETSGLRTDLDLVEVAFEFDKRLREWSTKTAVSFATHSNASSSQCAYRVQLLPFYVSYLRLVVLSLGFQQVAQKRNGKNDGPRPEIVKRCLNAASSVLRTVVEDLAQTDYLRFAPDGHFVFSSFAAAFLIKMLRPEHASLLEGDERNQIMEIVERLIDTFKSPRIAVDSRHTPMLYSRFLASLIAKYKEDGGADIGDGATSVDSVGVPTPPMHKQEPHSPQGPGGVKSPPPPPPGINAAMRRHRPSPSIEISPAPDPSSNGPPPPSQTIFDPETMVDNSLFPAMDDANLTTYAPSTIHAASTVHGGSQHGGQVAFGQMLLPMYAINNEGFWNSMLPPGLTWPQEDWAMNLDTIEEYPQETFDTHYQADQVPQQYPQHGYPS